MRTKLSLLAIFSFAIFSISGYAQEKEQLEEKNTEEKKEYTAHYNGDFLKHLNVAVGFSTLGINVEAATPVTSYLKLRAGINFFSYKTNDNDINLDDPDHTLQKAFGYIPTYRLNGQFKTTHGHALVDYYPFKKGIFHVTAGFYMGKTNFKANGALVDTNGNTAILLPGNEWPTIDFDGNTLEVNQGRLDAELKFGNAIKPYLGIGLGRAVSKRRFGAKFEIGVLYQGDYEITQNKKVVATSNKNGASMVDTEDYEKWLKFWPMLNFQLNYRLF